MSDELGAIGYRFRGGSGWTGTATAGTTSNIDYLLSADRDINGIELILDGNQVLGDYVDFQVIDTNGITGAPAGTVLDEFGTNWWVDPDKKSQGTVFPGYRAKLYNTFTLRIVYHSTGNTDVVVRANVYLHKPPA